MVSFTICDRQRIAVAANDCHFFFNISTGASGSFRTPTEPPADTYPPNTDCLFEFRAEKGWVVWIDWHTFHLEAPMVRNNQ